MQDPAALGRAGRLEVPPRRAPDRRDPRGGERARLAPHPPRRPLVGLRERARGQSPHARVLLELTAPGEPSAPADTAPRRIRPRSPAAGRGRASAGWPATRRDETSSGRWCDGAWFLASPAMTRASISG